MYYVKLKDIKIRHLIVKMPLVIVISIGTSILSSLTYVSLCKTHIRIIVLFTHFGEKTNLNY